MVHGDVVVRPATNGDLPFLWAVLVEVFGTSTVSLVIPTVDEAMALAPPYTRKYLDKWGRVGDTAVVAVDQAGRQLGAAWYRLFPSEAGSYGFVAPSIPEITIGVANDARGMGVGSALLRALLVAARSQGYRALSLSVDRQNPARALYERFGFRDAGISASEDSSVTMLVSL